MTGWDVPSHPNHLWLNDPRLHRATGQWERTIRRIVDAL